MDDGCYWCRQGAFETCIRAETLRLAADTKRVIRQSWNFCVAFERWASFGYIYVNKKYGALGSFIGGSLGNSGNVPNN